MGAPCERKKAATLGQPAGRECRPFYGVCAGPIHGSASLRRVTEPAATAEVRNLPILTSFRWYAALCVFLYHYLQWTDFILLRPLGFGYVGVSFFFVLSGFVLAWSHRRDVPAVRFWANRFARIYPAHFVMFVVAVMFVGIGLEEGGANGPAKAVSQVLLLHAWWPSGNMLGFNGVSWSLSAEAFFYLCFPLLIAVSARSRRTMSWITATSLVLGLAFAAYCKSQGLEAANTAYYNPLSRLPEFLLGVWLAQRVRDNAMPQVPMWFAATLTAVLGVIAWRFALPWYPASDYLLLPGVTALIVAGAQYDLAGRGSAAIGLLRSRASVFLGEVSFAFYLTHQLMLVLVHADKDAPELMKFVMLALAFAASLLAAAALHVLVERPARTWLRAHLPMLRGGTLAVR